MIHDSNLKQALRCGLADHVWWTSHSPTSMVVFMKFLLSSNLFHLLPLPLTQKRASVISHHLIYPPTSLFTFSSLVGNKWLLPGATCAVDPSSFVKSAAQDFFLMLSGYHHFLCTRSLYWSINMWLLLLFRVKKKPSKPSLGVTSVAATTFLFILQQNS